MAENGGNIVLQVLYAINKRSEQNVNNSIEKVKQKSSSVESAYTKAFGKIGKAIAAAFSIAAITKFINTATAAYKVQAVAESKLETIMRQRMGATDAEIEKIKQLSSEYQNLGLVGDEVAEAGMAQLAMFTKNVSSLEKLMPSFENALIGLYGMEPTAGNAQGLATQIGKALSSGKTSGLGRLGIVFTEAEQHAFELGNEIERANMLSIKLQNTFGNVNSELAKTPVGRIQQLKNSFSDVMELFGQAFTNIFASFVPVLQTVVGWLDSIARKLVQISELIYTAFGGVLKKTGGGGVAGALEDMAEGFEDVGGAAGGAKESLASFDNVVQLADSSGGGSSSGAGAFDLTELEFENTALEKTESILDRIGKKVKEFFNQPLFDFSRSKAILESIGKSAKDIFEGIRPSAEGFITSYINSIKTCFATLFSVGKQIAETLLGGIAISLEENKPRIIDDLNAVFGNLSTIYDNFASIISIIGDTIKKFLNLETTVKGISNVITVVTNLINALVRFITGVIADITTKIKAFLENHKEEIDHFMQTVSALFYEVSETIKIVVNGVIDFFKKYVMPALSFIWDGIWGQIDAFVAMIINILDSLLDSVRGVFEIINGILTGDSAKAWQGLEDVIAGVANAIIGLVEGIVNGVVNGINWVISGLNKLKIPGTDIGVNINPLSNVKIPRLAEGGIVYKPTDFGGFMAGEAGAEAIVPLQNSGYTKQLANEIVKGLRDAGFGGGDTYNIENAFGDERSMERLVNKIDEIKQKKEARKGAVVYA